jgi:hypothetical protein
MNYGFVIARYDLGTKLFFTAEDGKRVAWTKEIEHSVHFATERSAVMIMELLLLPMFKNLVVVETA